LLCHSGDIHIVDWGMQAGPMRDGTPHSGLASECSLPARCSSHLFGDSFEHEGTDREYFVTFSVDGYAFGINVLVYAMTD
jgi:hypothetical protein